MMKMKFTKYQGLGNDFVIVQDRSDLPPNLPSLARRICDRHYGVGADNVVTVRVLPKNNYELRIYNSDGSETETCGNASRCVALYIKSRKLGSGREYALHTRGGIVRAEVFDNDMVCVDMGEPRLKRGEIPMTGDPDGNALEVPVPVAGKSFVGTGVSMGNPHLVIFVPDINAVELENWGAQLEHCELYPRKTNVEFVEVISRSMVRMRVFERGCGVTRACGSGSCATAVAGVLRGLTERKITVLLDGGELQIEYRENDNHIYMTGPATEVFRGEILL